jgi:glycine/D-amino acid oxidase-like deaminating enzyme
MAVSLLSFWERDQYLNGIDVVIAGSGIVGLSAAIALKKKNPSLRILVAERGALPSGASTKNAGFACFGSLTELMDDLSHINENEVFALVGKRYRGLKRLRENVGDANMKLEMLGGYEVFDTSEEFQSCAEKMAWFNAKLKPITGLSEVYADASDKISSFGLGQVKHMIHNRGEGQIDTGRMMSALIDKAKSAGITILNGLVIVRFEEEEQQLAIHTRNGFTIRCSQLIICTNGFAKQLLPEEDVDPARAQVVVTNEIPGLKLRGTFHYEKGYYYFRNIGNRVLFGGGRNLDFGTERTTEHALTPVVQEKLDDLLQHMILPGINYSIDMRWAGTMGVGQTKSPIVRKIQNRVHCAVRMGGMGVALGSLTGEEVAELVLKEL